MENLQIQNNLIDFFIKKRRSKIYFLGLLHYRQAGSTTMKEGGISWLETSWAYAMSGRVAKKITGVKKPASYP